MSGAEWVARERDSIARALVQGCARGAAVALDAATLGTVVGRYQAVAERDTLTLEFAVRDGEVIAVGRFRLEAIATPGTMR